MKTPFYSFLILICFALSGCAVIKNNNSNMTSMKALYSNNKIVLDAKLDEPVWKKAQPYFLDSAKKSESLDEKGQVYLAWDDIYFYIGAKFYDSDIVAEGMEDQIKQFQFGDVCELLLKPIGQTWSWEFQVAPNNKKSSLWFPGVGRLGLPSNLKYNCGLKAAADYTGSSINDWCDKDNYWTVEMAIPIKDINFYGEKFPSDSKWSILIGRYNYSRYLPSSGPELSSAPKLSKKDFHLYKEYAIIKFQK